MDIRTITVNLDVDSYTPALVSCAARLASRFEADLVAVASAEPITTASIAVPPYLSAVYETDREALETRMAGIEDDVRTHVLSGQKFHWVGLLAPPNDALADLAATTDLFLVGHQTPRRMRRTRSLDVGELVVSTARPVLIAGAGVDAVRAERIVVGWKNTRETRRAVADALPLMARATAVAFVAIDDGAPEADSGLADAVGWAKSHGIKAGSRLLPADGDTARALKEAVSDFGGDLLVTGAYGHTRAREWLFGGVTRALLETTDINLLMSN